MSEKYVYTFGDGKAEGNAKMKLLLGGKGANLAEMSNFGIPVPAGFTISTDICTEYYESDGNILMKLKNKLKMVLNISKKLWAQNLVMSDNPLLLSVRSGAPASMPGMMDTVLNLGLNDKTVQGLIKKRK